MNGFKIFLFATISIIVIFLSAGTSPTLVEASNPKSVKPSVETEIKNIVQSYFEVRYRTLNTLQLEDFNNLVSNQPETQVFLNAELGKLAVEIRHAELNKLRYADYNFFLDYKNISINETTETASVLLSLRHDVIYEISLELNPMNPIVSHAYNLKHNIVLHKEHGEWKIVSDDYTDYLWRLLRKTKTSTNEMLSTMEALSLPALRRVGVQTEFSCNLSQDDTTHPYDRQEAINYALTHIQLEKYNPNYPDYNGDPANPWGDCTNFVSQAMYEGGKVSMAYCDQTGPFCTIGPDGNIGWFFANESFRASAWTDVSKLGEFIIDYSVWNEGPEGCVVSIDQLEIGDIIQYKWDDDNIWDHAVIVVDIINGMPFVASHSDNVGPVPYTGPDYFASFSAIRFIHIERSDGISTAPVLTPTPTLRPSQNVDILISQGSDDGGTNPGDCAFYNTDNEVYLGACSNGDPITSGFRFQNVQIPHNANIESAHLNFTVDGTYTTPIQVQVYGEASSNSLTYSESSPPTNRLTTFNSILWNITDVWGLGALFNTPDLSEIIQEIVNRPDWNSGQPISLILKHIGGGTEHRRVIGFERAELDTDLDTVQLIITYNTNSAPTPTTTPLNYTSQPSSTATSILPTFTLLPPPTVAPTDPPTEIPWICSVCGIGCPASAQRLTANGTGLFGTPTPYATTPAPATSSSLRITETVDLTTLLYRVRDEILSATPEGQRLTDLYYSYIPHIVQVLMANPELSDQSLETMNLFAPALQGLLDGNGDTVTITSEQVMGLQSFLNALVEQGDPELQAVILSELERHPLDSVVGMTIDEAWSYTNGYQLEWLPPISNSNPYRANQGSAIPVKFTITDFDGNFVIDESVTLQVLDANGKIVVGSISVSNNPNNGIKVQGDQYHYNLNTKYLSAGSYILQITYSSSNGTQAETRSITLTKKK